MEPLEEGKGHHPMLVTLGNASMAACRVQHPGLASSAHEVHFEGMKQTWLTSYRRGCRALDKGNMRDALDHFKSALEQSEATPNRTVNPAISVCANALGFCYQLLGLFTPDTHDAQYFNQKAYEQHNTAFRIDNDNMPRYQALTLFLSSKLYLKQKQLQKAENLFLQSLSSLGDEKPIWPMPVTTAALHHHQGLLHLANHKIDEARDSMKEAMKLLSAHLGPNHAWVKHIESQVKAIHQTEPGEVIPLPQSDQAVDNQFGLFFESLVDEMRLMPKN